MSTFWIDYWGAGSDCYFYVAVSLMKREQEIRDLMVRKFFEVAI